MTGIFFCMTIFGCTLSGFIGMMIGNLGGKSNGSTGFVLGFLLGPLGWLLIAITVLTSIKEAAENASEMTLLRLQTMEEEIAELKAMGKQAVVKSNQPKSSSTALPVYQLD
jgi:hypothetical protein